MLELIITCVRASISSGQKTKGKKAKRQQAGERGKSAERWYALGSFIGTSNCLDLNGLIHHVLRAYASPFAASLPSLCMCLRVRCVRVLSASCGWGKGSPQTGKEDLCHLCFSIKLRQRLQSVFVITFTASARKGVGCGGGPSLPLLSKLIATLGMVVHVMFLNHVLCYCCCCCCCSRELSALDGHEL